VGSHACQGGGGAEPIRRSNSAIPAEEATALDMKDAVNDAKAVRVEGAAGAGAEGLMPRHGAWTGKGLPRRNRRALVFERAGLFQEVVVAAGVAGDFSVLHVEDFRREFADEMHVVRDEDERAGIVLQREDERLDGCGCRGAWWARP